MSDVVSSTEQAFVHDVVVNDTTYHVRCFTLQDNNTIYCAKDVGKLLNISNIRATITNIDKKDKQICKIPTNGGAQSQVFLTVKGLQKIMTKSRSINAKVVAQHFGMDVLNTHVICIESSTLDCIMKAFSGENIVLQYQVELYRIDLYFPKFKLAIECDEWHHTKQHENDAERQRFIETALNCTFIRYDPCAKSFDIFKLINNIYKHIRNHG